MRRAARRVGATSDSSRKEGLDALLVREDTESRRWRRLWHGTGELILLRLRASAPTIASERTDLVSFQQFLGTAPGPRASRSARERNRTGIRS